MNNTLRIIFVWAFALSFIFTPFFPNPTYASPTWEQKANKVIQVAKQNKHKKYKAGQAGPDEFDCSGFTQYVFKQAIQLSLPRTSSDQANQGKTIEKTALKKGDLLFFKTNGSNISHVSIYIGNGEMIHAVNERDNITISSINDSYWKKHFVHAKRVIDA